MGLAMSLSQLDRAAQLLAGWLSLALAGNGLAAELPLWRWPSPQAVAHAQASEPTEVQGLAGHQPDLPAALTLRAQAHVDSQGVFLAQVVEPGPGAGLPHVRLAEAPAFGQTLVLTRADIQAALRSLLPHATSFTLAGAQQVRVFRRSRLLHESELKALLTDTLQQEHAKDKGQLELRFTRPWSPTPVPDEPLTVRVLDLPSTGFSPHFIVRFELVTARDRLGPWQMPVQARLWREVWVARSLLQPGTPWAEADVARDRRDVLGLREPLLPDPVPAESGALLELAEAVPAGAAITQRAVRLRSVVRRGQIVEAVLADGALTIRLKAEVLESGAPGQLVRLRNLESKREFKGKVQDAQTVLVQL
jgi:flagella basal body P-ring formation protein FlgA